MAARDYAEGVELLQRLGWTFSVTTRGRGSGWQGPAVWSDRRGDAGSVYVAGTTEERVQRALVRAALALIDEEDTPESAPAPHDPDWFLKLGAPGGYAQRPTVEP